MSSVFQVAPAYGIPYVAQLPQVYSARPPAVYVPAAYDAGARFDGHAMPIVPVSAIILVCTPKSIQW